MSIITVSNIYAEDLFKWFYEHIMDSCGDGAGLIVCKNYKETAQFFLDWFKQNIRNDITYNANGFYHPTYNYENIINFHNGNENFMFSDTTHKMFDVNYIFIVKDECGFGWDKTNNKKIEPVGD